MTKPFYASDSTGEDNAPVEHPRPSWFKLALDLILTWFYLVLIVAFVVIVARLVLIPAMLIADIFSL